MCNMLSTHSESGYINKSGIYEGNKASQMHLFNTNKYMHFQFTKQFPIH